MLKGNQMQTSIKLTEKQLALLLQVLDILETAENKITSLY